MIKTKQIILAFVCLGVVIYFREVMAVGSKFLSIFKPILFGGFIALLLNSPLNFFEHRILKSLAEKNKKIARFISLLLCLSLIALVVLFFIYALFPQIKQSIIRLLENLPTLIEDFNKFSTDTMLAFNFNHVTIGKVNAFFSDKAKEAVNYVMSSIPDLLKVITKISGKVFSFVISLVFAGYLLFDKEKIAESFKSLSRRVLKEKNSEKVIKVAGITTYQFENFFSGQVLEAFILGFLCFIGMLVLEIPYAPLVSTIVGLTAIIPLIGGFIGTIPSILFIAVESPISAVVFLVFIIILQLVEGNFIYPFVVGNKLTLSPFWVLFAVVVGGGLMGVLGVFLAVPVASSIHCYMSERNKL